VTLLRLGLRSHLGGGLAITAIGVVNMLAQTLGYAQLGGRTPLERAIFAQQMELLGRQLTYLLPLPRELDTLAGYLDWRGIGFMPVVLGFWAVVAASGAGRGDEERGLVEQWTAAGVGRLRYVASRAAAFALVGMVVLTATIAAAALGAAAAGEPISTTALAAQGLAMLTLLLCCYAIGLFCAQLVATRRGAAALAGAVLLTAFLVNSAARAGALEGLRWLSPFWAHDQSHPLLRAGRLDGGATAALLVVALAFLALAAAGFRARDLGAELFRGRARPQPATVRPSSDPLLAIPVLAQLDQQRVSIALWMAAVAAVAAFLISMTRVVVDALMATPTLRAYVERAGLDSSYASFIGLIGLSTLLLLISLYAIAQVSGWAADDAEGRLEIVLAQPVSRTRVVGERLVSVLAGSALVVGAGAVATIAAASAVGITLDAGRFVLASALALAVVLAFSGLGAAGVAWRPRVAVAVLAAIAVTSYFLKQFAPLFDWPRWVADLSLYALYGQPLSREIDWIRIAALAGVGVGGAAVAVTAMQRRDVGR
jgi:putative exporter of polyketide antibiotics